MISRKRHRYPLRPVRAAVIDMSGMTEYPVIEYLGPPEDNMTWFERMGYDEDVVLSRLLHGDLAETGTKDPTENGHVGREQHVDPLD